MLKLSDMRLTHELDKNTLHRVSAEQLGISETAVRSVKILKQSVDARRKPDVRLVYTVLVEADGEREVLKKKLPNVSQYNPPQKYAFPVASAGSLDKTPPVIAGMGPAGLFAALCLAEAGVKCIILERGQPVERRIRDVGRFWADAALDCESNVQFGEGGAGTFSDGKLTTGVNDPRMRFVLEKLVELGAPDDILYLSKPHIGTDRLRTVVKTARERLIALGCDIRFGHKLCDLEISDGVLTGMTAAYGGKTYALPHNRLILAPGHSARDTFEMLQKRGVLMTAKDFAVGVRIEHLQRDIDLTQYGRQTPPRTLPASDYKLAAHLGGGRTVYTFCVCPGGQVVAAASEPGGTVTNGMSYYARAGENCNGALLVTVNTGDFPDKGPLAGLAFQRSLERAAFEAGGGSFYAPAQLVGDFLHGRASVACGRVKPTYLPGVRCCDLRDVLPEFICSALRDAFPELNRRVSGFAAEDAVLTAVETRTSSPVRIERENYEAPGVRGLYPCGEGAGYAGGIMSAAVDGIKCAEALCLS